MDHLTTTPSAAAIGGMASAGAAEKRANTIGTGGQRGVGFVVGQAIGYMDKGLGLALLADRAFPPGFGECSPPVGGVSAGDLPEKTR